MTRVEYGELDTSDGDTYYWREQLFTGIAYELRRDGQLWTETGFLNGQYHGPSRTWYPSGQLQEETTSYNGLVYGPKREWDEAGQLRREALMEYGVRVREKKWDEAGRLMEEYEIAPDDPHYSWLQEAHARYGEHPRLGPFSVEAEQGIAEKAGAAEKAADKE